MNKVFCDALKLTAYIYTECMTGKTLRYDDNVFLEAKSILEQATDRGLVRWVGNLPLVNVSKMTGET